MLRKAPAFTAAAVITIALGIAANTAVFSVANAAVIRSLPFADPDRLMQVAERNQRLNLAFFSVSSLNYLSWKEQTRAFEDLGIFGYANYTVTGRGEPEEVSGNPISASLVPLLGLRPLAGRTFRPDEDKPGNALVVMIGDGLWERRFGRDPAVIGQPLAVNGVAHTLVGVIGPELKRLTGGDLYVPMVIDATRENRLSHVNSVIGRLNPGVSMAAAQVEMDGIGRRVVEQFPDVRDWSIQVRSLDAWLVSDELRTAVKVLLGAVGLLLLAVCANVANLVLSRAVARQKEFAIRGAIGASRARLARQLVIEGLVLSLAGGLLGLLLAAWAVKLLTMLPANQQPVAGIRIDTNVLLFTLAVSGLTGVLFGMVPAWHGSRADLNAVLQQGARSSHSHLRPLLRNGQAALQLALAAVLVVGASLLTESLLRLQGVAVGFDPSNVLTFRLTLPAKKYPDHAKSWAFYRQMLESIERLPGVRSAAISSALPFGSGTYTRTPMSTPSRSVLPPGTQVPIDWRVVSPGFFRTLGIPLVFGRDFTEQDSPQSAPVMVVSRSMARKYWGDDDPIGKVVHLVNARGKTVADYNVVGVVGDVRNISLNEELPAVYYSSSWRLWPSMEVAVRAQGKPGAVLPMIRKAIGALDPDLPLATVQTMDEAMAASASQPRFNAVLLMVFAGLALLVAGVGIYGVLGYSVSQRTHEIGMRMALGAERATVMRQIVGEGLVVGLAGTALGLAAAAMLGRVVASLLFGVHARDPLVFAAAGVGLVAVALVACIAPAWRASRVDPMVALRTQ
jgi:putative ABC transport system permease protein